MAALLATAAATAMSATQAQTPTDVVQVYAAGSLREALAEIVAGYEARNAARVMLTLGASGLLRERIEKGAGAQVFASADTDHPQRLAQAGGWNAPVILVRNALCALTQPQIDTRPAGLLDTMLRRDVRLGTSTPKADPSGDYAWALFRQAEALRPGAYAALDAKALKLTGGADSPKPPAGRGTYAWVMDQGQADVFLTYCTNAVASQREVPRLKIVAVPPELQVSAAYGLTVRSTAPVAASQFAQYLLSADAQAVFQRFGFGQP